MDVLTEGITGGHGIGHPAPLACHQEVPHEKCPVPYTLHHIGVEGSSRDLSHTLSCYRQDTGKLRPGGWGHAADQVGKRQLPQSSYKGELPSLHHAEHKVLRLGHYFVRQMAVTRRAWERNTVSPVHPPDGVLLLLVYPRLC